MDTQEFRKGMELIKQFKALPDVMKRIHTAFPAMKGVRCGNGIGGSREEGPCLVLFWSGDEPQVALESSIIFQSEIAAPVTLQVKHKFTGPVELL